MVKYGRNGRKQKKSLARRKAEALARLIVSLVCAGVMVYFVACYIDITCKNTASGLELESWNLAHDYKMELMNK